MRMINPTIATTITMTTTFEVAEDLARDHECGGNVALASTERHDQFCVAVRTAEQPTSLKAQCDK